MNAADKGRIYPKWSIDFELDCAFNTLSFIPVPTLNARDDLFDIDSMDYLNFIIGLSKVTGLDIPEGDYPRLESLSGCRQYLAERNRLS